MSFESERLGTKPEGEERREGDIVKREREGDSKRERGRGRE